LQLLEIDTFQGLSIRNLKYMRQFAHYYPNFRIVQEVLAQ